MPILFLGVFEKIDEFTGDRVAGDLERTLAEKPESVVRAMRENPYVKAVTENMDLEMFRQLVALDRAKTLADQLINAAKEYAPENKGEEIQKQNEQEVQKQQEAPNPMAK